MFVVTLNLFFYCDSLPVNPIAVLFLSSWEVYITWSQIRTTTEPTTVEPNLQAGEIKFKNRNTQKYMYICFVYIYTTSYKYETTDGSGVNTGPR